MEIVVPMMCSTRMRRVTVSTMGLVERRLHRLGIGVGRIGRAGEAIDLGTLRLQNLVMEPRRRVLVVPPRPWRAEGSFPRRPSGIRPPEIVTFTWVSPNWLGKS